MRQGIGSDLAEYRKVHLRLKLGKVEREKVAWLRPLTGVSNESA